VTTIDAIFALYADRGSASYFGEAVTQAEHALQTAHLAETDKAPPPLIVAALLHDIGHLLHTAGEDVAKRGVDTRHERIGARWLTPHFGRHISEPVRLHVAAKRYLCAIDPDYFARLSPASVKSLELQGGVMRFSDTRQFERQDHWREAVRLRRWDEEAKVPGLIVPPIEHYQPQLEACLQPDAENASENATRRS